MAFETDPIVKLEAIIQRPYELAVASARTCYSSKGIIKIDDVSATDKSRELRDRIADSTRDAGHLTTRQHAHFVFSIDKVSRQFLWSFLHAHPFYNSEQVSQRYVKVGPGNYTVPIMSGNLTERFKKIMDRQMHDYNALIELSMPEIENRYFKIFPFRMKTREKYTASLKKRAFEIARYVLPVATHAYLYHTVSALTLLRYHRLSQYFEVAEETRAVVDKMIQAACEADPLFARELIDPLPLEQTPEYQFFTARDESLRGSTAFIKNFDDELGKKYSLLTDYKINAEKTLADSVRSVLGVLPQNLPDAAAIDLVLSPQKNPHFADTLNVNTLSKITRALFHVHYTFKKRISHTADSQDQRHRLVPGSRPMLTRHYTGEPDFITPLVIAENDQLRDFYENSMRQTFSDINNLVADGASLEHALYLLPNAFPIRFEESGDLLDLHHKWKARACYTAQEEIFFATLDELEQVGKIHPQIAKHILAPCYLRKEAGVKPFCPEGDRFCGVRVWQQEIADYRNRIL